MEAETTTTETTEAPIIEEHSREAEDPAVLEKFYGENWRDLFPKEETKDEPASGDGAAVAGAGDTANGGVDTGAASPADGVGADAGTAGAGGVAEGDAGATPATDPAAEELKQLAELGRQWKTAFATDPKGAIASLLNTPAFTAEDKASLFADVQQRQAAAATQIDPSKYEPASDFEKALMPNLDWLRAGESKVAEALQVRDRDIQHTFVETTALAARLDAVIEFLGVKLPAHDTAAIFKHFDASPEGTLQDAVAKVYREAALKAARLEKQKATERPDTLRNGAGSERKPAQINSLADAYAEAGLQLGITS